MLQSHILKYFSEQRESFFENYKIAIKAADFNAIHDMRVSVKRLDTMFRMLNFDTKANYRLKRSFEPIKAVFKKTGKIRDYQIFTELLTEYQSESENEYSSLISGIKSKSNKIYNEYIETVQLSHYQFLKRNFRVMEKHIKSKSKTELISKMEHLRSKSELLFKTYSIPDDPFSNLHKARKAIKDLSYLIEMSGNDIQLLDELLAKYKSTGRILGDWHDRAILHNYLLFLKSESATIEKKFEGLIEKVKINKDHMRKQFYSISI